MVGLDLNATKPCPGCDKKMIQVDAGYQNLSMPPQDVWKWKCYGCNYEMQGGVFQKYVPGDRVRWNRLNS